MADFQEPAIKWAKSKAKQLLLVYLKDGRVPLDAKATDENGKRLTSKLIYEKVCVMDEENKKYDPSKFPTRLGALRKKIREEKNPTPKFKEPDIPWKSSKAKKLLVKYLRAGMIPFDPKAQDANNQQLTPKRIFELLSTMDEMGEEIKKYDPQNFASRLRGARAQVAGKMSRAEEDLKHFEEFVRLHPCKTNTAYHGFIYWQGSEAQKLVKHAIANNLLELMKKKDLHKTRPEYKHFPLDKFRDYIYQELRTAKHIYSLNDKEDKKKAAAENAAS